MTSIDAPKDYQEVQVRLIRIIDPRLDDPIWPTRSPHLPDLKDWREYRSAWRGYSAILISLSAVIILVSALQK